MENLAGLGTTAELRFRIDLTEVSAATQAHQNDFRIYNPRKPKDRRWGLSLTSRDGGLSGVPDLDSLLEFNKLNGTDYKESSFKTTTPVAHKIPSLQKLFETFGSHIGRSHIIRFERGGLFPPHRDGYPGLHPYFRIFSLLSPSSVHEYHFVINGRLETFLPGSTYFIDTQVVHSFVSFVDELMILVVNVEDTPDSRNILYRHLAVT